MCSVLPDRWFTPHFAVCAEFALSSWDATVERARIHSPLWPACWLDCPDRSRSSQSPVIRDIWDVYIRWLVSCLWRFVLTFFVCVTPLM